MVKLSNSLLKIYEAIIQLFVFLKLSPVCKDTTSTQNTNYRPTNKWQKECFTLQSALEWHKY